MEFVIKIIPKTARKVNPGGVFLQKRVALSRIR